MELSHEFEVPVGIDEAWAVLTDVERIAPCMPGATLEEVDGDEFRGRVKVKVGPIQLTYKGTATFTAQDPEARTATLEAKGSETRGGGTAAATVQLALTEKETSLTAGTVHTDLAITGKPAQFGRSLLSDVGDKLIGAFVACLTDELTAEPAGAAEEEEGVEAPRRERAAAEDTLDLLDLAGAPVLKRLAPVVALVALAIAVVVLLRRRRG